MEPLNDNELRDLLCQWEAPAAPAYLEHRIFDRPRKQPWYSRLLTGSIRVPIPVLVLLLVMLSALAYLLPRMARRCPRPRAR